MFNFQVRTLQLDTRHGTLKIIATNIIRCRGDKYDTTECRTGFLATQNCMHLLVKFLTLRRLLFAALLQIFLFTCTIETN